MTFEYQQYCSLLMATLIRSGPVTITPLSLFWDLLLRQRVMASVGAPHCCMLLVHTIYNLIEDFKLPTDLPLLLSCIYSLVAWRAHISYFLSVLCWGCWLWKVSDRWLRWGIKVQPSCGFNVSSSDSTASSAGLGVLVHRGLPVSLVHVSEKCLGRIIWKTKGTI